MNHTIKGEKLAKVLHDFVRKLSETDLHNKIDLKEILDTLPNIKLKKGYSLGSYFEGNCDGTSELLYPFRTGSTDEYEPGAMHRDMDLDSFWIWRGWANHDPEAQKLKAELDNFVPFKDGQYASGCYSYESSETIPKLQDYLDVDFTPETVWEALLLTKEANSYLSQGYHTSYKVGKLIVDNKSLTDVCQNNNKFKTDNWKQLLNDERIIPKVTMTCDYIALVYYCRWNDDDGLIRFCLRASHNRRTINFEEVEKEYLIQYKNGLYI